MKRVALLAILALLSLPARAAYTTATVNGSYSFLLNNWTPVSGGNSASLGILSFDGIGGVSGSFLQMTSSGPQNFAIQSGSTYSVERNGTGSMSLVTTSGILPFTFVLTSVSGRVARQLQLLFLNTSATNGAIAGTAVAIYLPGPGNNANLKGVYSFLFNDWQADPNTPVWGAVGTLRFDGKNSVTFSYSQELEGVSQTQTVVGTYSVDAEGSGTMVFSIDQATATFVFGINNVHESIARGLQFMNAGSDGNNTISTGSATLQ